jgi:hypothetical protein
MFILFLVIFIVTAIIVGIGDWIKKKYQTKRDCIDYLPYGGDERTNARKALLESNLNKWRDIFEGIKDTVVWINIAVTTGAAGILIIMAFLWSPNIDEKIALYEEENIKIETQIAAVVNEYQEFEYSIITECKPESAMTLVTLYPDLKSDTLVTKQIETYIANNDKIKQLKEEKIKQSIIGWWFNFNAW